MYDFLHKEVLYCFLYHLQKCWVWSTIAKEEENMFGLNVSVHCDQACHLPSRCPADIFVHDNASSKLKIFWVIVAGRVYSDLRFITLQIFDGQHRPILLRSKLENP